MGATTLSDPLSAAHHAQGNQAEIEGSVICGCFCSMQTFPPSEVLA